MIRLHISGVAEPSEDQMKELVGTMFLGVFFATFWLSFAYGVFRLIKRGEQATEPPDEPPPKA
jgi:hypothetical protein